MRKTPAAYFWLSYTCPWTRTHPPMCAFTCTHTVGAKGVAHFMKVFAYHPQGPGFNSEYQKKKKSTSRRCGGRRSKFRFILGDSVSSRLVHMTLVKGKTGSGRGRTEGTKSHTTVSFIHTRLWKTKALAGGHRHLRHAQALDTNCSSSAKAHFPRPNGIFLLQLFKMNKGVDFTRVSNFL